MTWRFLWWVSVRLRYRCTGPFEVLLLAPADDHVGQQRDELGSLFRCDRCGLRRSQRELGQRWPAEATWLPSASGHMTFIGRPARRCVMIGEIRLLGACGDLAVRRVVAFCALPDVELARRRLLRAQPWGIDTRGEAPCESPQRAGETR